MAEGGGDIFSGQDSIQGESASAPVGAGAADPNAKKENANENGDTPLHLAARVGDLGAVESLLASKANPDAQNKHDDGAIHVAAENGHVAVRFCEHFLP